jgi:hypothetical protein
MKNIILLLVFFLIIGVMFSHYFVPNINRENNIDQIESALQKVKKAIPVTSKIYFLTQGNIQENPEIYYKVQFSLAPRVVIAEKYENVPHGSYMLQFRDKKNTGEGVMYPIPDYIFADRNEFFETTLLKKNQ